MPTFAPVVCAFDAPRESEGALVAAADLAARAGGVLHLVFVRPALADDAYRAPSDPEARVRAVVEVAVDRALGAGACAEIAPRIVAAREDDPAAAVSAYAGEVAAGVLVLGTHGRKGLQRLRLGSVAEAVVRRAPCPVLVVPNRSAGRTPGPSRPVLAAVDFSDLSAAALARARPLADLYGAPLDVLHVVDGLDRAGLGASALAAHEIGMPAPRPPTEADVRGFAERVGAGDVRVQVVVGSPAKEVAARAEALDAGAVVMGTHGRGGVARALFGSVTEGALRRVRCPVLAVRTAR